MQWDNTFYNRVGKIPLPLLAARGAAAKLLISIRTPAHNKRLLYHYSSPNLYEILLYTYIKRRIPLDSSSHSLSLYPSIPYTFLTESMVPPLWYKSDSLANVPSWHILTSFKSSWTIMWYLFNMPANVNLLLYPALSSPTFLSHSNTGLSLSSIVKAYSLGTFICHTTDILSNCFFYIVHWIKPPFLNIIHFLWIGYIIPLQPIFVNTILKFYIFNLFIHLYIYNFLIFVFISHNLHNISNFNC